MTDSSEILEFDPATDYRSLFGRPRFPLTHHFALFPFAPQTVRIVLVQASSIASNYMSDELSGDIKRDEMVSKGKMTQADADKERQEWTKVR